MKKQKKLIKWLEANEEVDFGIAYAKDEATILAKYVSKELKIVVTPKEIEKAADIQKRTIKIFFNEQNDPNFRINIDPKRLTEVLDNLLSNAIKYNRLNGSITISV